MKPVNNQIKIKTERDIEAQLGIKVENPISGCIVPRNATQVSNGMPSTVSTSPSNRTELCSEEKNKLIGNILSLKSGNQTLVQKLNEKDAELKASKKLLQEKVLELNLFSKIN